MVGTRETDGFEHNHCSVVIVEHFYLYRIDGYGPLGYAIRDLKHTIATIMTNKL